MDVKGAQTLQFSRNLGTCDNKTEKTLNKREDILLGDSSSTIQKPFPHEELLKGDVPQSKL